MPVDRKELLHKLRQLPSLPSILQELIASFNNANLDTVSLAHKIEHDQGLSAKVLRMANSSFYGLPRKVGSIQDAVTVLGFDTVRSLVLSAGIIQIFPPTPGSLFNRQEYWQRSYRIATISKALSKNLQQGQDFAFTAGMFCEIGQIVLDLCIPQEFSGLLQRQADSGSNLVELELSELGFDHFEIGADVVRLWNFPPEIEQLIRHWNEPEVQAASNPLACVVHIAASLGNGDVTEESISKLSQAWCERIPITQEQIRANLPPFEQLENFFQHDSSSLLEQ